MVDINDVFGPGGLATRFAWGGAFLSAIAWLFVGKRARETETTPHRLTASLLTTGTMLALDVALVIFFWPSDVWPRPSWLNIGGEGARALVAFIVGMQVMAALWHVTIPKYKKGGR